jgi:uncharacterized membrane protein SirB2
MSAYAALKAVPVGSVATGRALFVLRGIRTLRRPERLALCWVHAVPHVVDTVLLASPARSRRSPASSRRR